MKRSPVALARIGGALYLAIIVIGIFGEMFVRDRLVVSNDPAATAANIHAAETLWRFHIATEIFLLICATVLLEILYVLLQPAGKELMRLAAFFNLVSIATELAFVMYLIAAVLPQGNVGNIAVRSHAYGFGVSLIFFGCFCLVVGYLIFKSGFLPKAIGVLMQIAGACYLINSFALIVSPATAHVLFPAILVPSLIGELSLCLWLLVKGVDEPKWRAAEAAARAMR